MKKLYTATLLAFVVTTACIVISRVVKIDLVTAALLTIMFIEFTSLLWDMLESIDQ